MDSFFPLLFGLFAPSRFSPLEKRLLLGAARHSLRPLLQHAHTSIHFLLLVFSCYSGAYTVPPVTISSAETNAGARGEHISIPRDVHAPHPFCSPTPARPRRHAPWCRDRRPNSFDTGVRTRVATPCATGRASANRWCCREKWGERRARRDARATSAGGVGPPAWCGDPTRTTTTRSGVRPGAGKRGGTGACERREHQRSDPPADANAAAAPPSPPSPRLLHRALRRYQRRCHSHGTDYTTITSSSATTNTTNPPC